MLAKSQQFFKQIDLFGQNISLNLNGDDQYKTGGGGVLSCMIVAIVAIFFQSNIVDFLGKTNIQAETQIVFEENPDRIKFTSDNFMFAISIEQSTAFNINPFFNISIKARTYVRLSNGTTIKYENLTNLVPCTLDRFQKIFDKYDLNFTDQYNQLGLSTWLCPELNYSLTVGGRYSSEYLDFAKIEITDCKNDTSNNAYLTWHPVCASKEVKDKWLSSEGSYRIRIYLLNKKNIQFIFQIIQIILIIFLQKFVANFKNLRLNFLKFQSFMDQVYQKIQKQTKINFQYYNI